MEQSTSNSTMRKSKETGSEEAKKRFQPPKPQVDEDPGAKVWYMGF